MFGEIFRNPTERNKVLYVHGEHTGRLKGCLPQKSGVLYTARLQSRLGLRLVILLGQRNFWSNICHIKNLKQSKAIDDVFTKFELIDPRLLILHSLSWSDSSGFLFFLHRSVWHLVRGQGHSIHINNPISNIHVHNIIKPCTIPSGLYMYCNVWGCFTFIYCYMCLLTDRRIQGPASSRQADTYSWTLAVR